MIITLWNKLQGKKSYIIAAAMLIYALLGIMLHEMTWQQAINYLFGSGALVAVKSALNKVG